MNDYRNYNSVIDLDLIRDVRVYEAFKKALSINPYAKFVGSCWDQYMERDYLSDKQIETLNNLKRLEDSWFLKSNNKYSEEWAEADDFPIFHEY